MITCDTNTIMATTTTTTTHVPCRGVKRKRELEMGEVPPQLVLGRHFQCRLENQLAELCDGGKEEDCDDAEKN